MNVQKEVNICIKIKIINSFMKSEEIIIIIQINTLKKEMEIQINIYINKNKILKRTNPYKNMNKIIMNLDSKNKCFLINKTYNK